MTRGNREIATETTVDFSAGKLVCSQAFPASAEQIARVRAFVRDNLQDHPARETAALLTTETATNSIRHSGTRFFGVNIIRIAGNSLRIIITDEGRTGTPHLQTSTTDTESGRGMRIIDLMTERWGIVRRPGIGTATWFDCAP